MSDKKQYPKRGEISADGLFYTNTDGRVFKRASDDCCSCDLRDEGGHSLCGADCNNGWWNRENAYVPSDEEREACEMALAQIIVCQEQRGHNCSYRFGQSVCSRITERTCPARKYLAAHGDENAWSVQ